MRTTITLEPDVDALVRRLMRERGISFKQAVNEAIRSGIAGDARTDPFTTPTRDMGIPSVPIEKALELAAALDDEELLRKQATRR